MSRISRSTLLIGTAILALAACSNTKGPGELGTKNDIVVRNHGMPQAAQQAAAPAPQTGDFTTTVEQGEAIPAPEVASAEALPDASPAVEQAVAAQAEASAPLPSAATSVTDTSAAINSVAPAQPVTQTVTPPAAADYATAPAQPAVIPPTPEHAPSVTGGVYPATDYPAAQTAQPVPAPAYEAPVAPTAPAPQPVAQPVALPEGVKYPLDKNAPYSPKAVEAAIEAAGATVPAAATAPTTAPTGNPSDAATIRAAQAALKARGLYAGAETGTVDAALLNGLIMYQAQMGLPQGGLNEATLRSLGVVQ